MSFLRTQWWRDRLYPDPERRLPSAEFGGMIERYLTPSSTVLDMGAGSGELNAYDVKGTVRRVVGIDLDPRVTDNPLLDEGVVGDLTAMPFEDHSFDVAFCIYVLEHVDQPERFVQEVRRVLRPGGMFLALTPNRRHYVPLLARMLPDRFHRWYNRKRGRDEADTFPTVYRLNTRRGLIRHFGDAGFDLRELRMIESMPHYLTFCLPAFLLGAAYERLVNCTEKLAGLRVNILCAFQSPGPAEDHRTGGPGGGEGQQ